jgi:hypothetical protein
MDMHGLQSHNPDPRTASRQWMSDEVRPLLTGRPAPRAQADPTGSMDRKVELGDAPLGALLGCAAAEAGGRAVRNI